MAGSSTDWGGLLIGGGVIVTAYLLYTSGFFNNLSASLQRPLMTGPSGPYGGCSDGSTPNPQTGLCANGLPPTGSSYPYPPQQQPPMTQPCYGQDMYTGQPCLCPSPYSTGSLLQQQTSPTCNCQNCNMGGYGANPYGQQSPYGTNPYGSPYGQPGSPYGSPYGTGGAPGAPGGYGLGGFPYPGIGVPGTPGYPSPYPYPSYPGIGGIGYPSPYPPIGYPPIGGVPILGSPVIASTIGGFPGGGPILVGGGGFPGGHHRGYQGTTDLNSFAGRAIAAEGFGY